MQQAGIQRQPLAGVVDGAHRVAMHGDQKVAAEECRDFVRRVATLDRTEDEEAVRREVVVLRQRVRRGRVLRRELVKAEPLLEQVLEKLLGRLDDVDPDLVIRLAAPRVDQLLTAAAKVAVPKNRNANGGHIKWDSAVYCRDCESATARYVIAPL